MAGIPYHDEDFNMAQSDVHRKMMYFLGALLDRVAAVAGLRGVSDCPIRYWFPAEGRQKKVLYPDYVLTANPEIATLTAKELLWTLEVVTTAHTGKERKDTVRMCEHNASHGIRNLCCCFLSQTIRCQ